MTGEIAVDEKALEKLTVDLVNIASPTGSEEPAALFLHDHFREMGLTSWTQEVEPGRRNVVGLRRGEGGGPTLLLMGHLDTVWAGDEEGIRDFGPGFQPHAVVDGDWIDGMGAYNMKGGLASAIAGVQAVLNSGAKLRGDVVVAGVVGETARCEVDGYRGPRYRAGGVGAWHLVSGGVTADMAIIPEPTHFRLSIASGGYVYFQVTTYGVPQATYRRGGSRFTEVSAPDALERLLVLGEGILRWGAGYVQRNRYRDELAANVSVIALRAGHPFRPTKTPSIARLYIEVDIMPGQHPHDVVEEFRAFVLSESDRAGLDRVDIDTLQAIGPAEIRSDEFVVSAVSRAHEAETQAPAEVTFDGWMADTTTLTRAGIPALCYGPGGQVRGGMAGFYSPHGEHAFIPDLALGARIFARTILDVCSRSREEVVRKNVS